MKGQVLHRERAHLPSSMHILREQLNVTGTINPKLLHFGQVNQKNDESNHVTAFKNLMSE